jgi:2-phospho-L-lactate guanylyltransferase
MAMLRDVLTAVGHASGIDGGLVVHSDPLVAKVATGMGMIAILESVAGDLNGALTQGLEHLAERGAEAVLILPADVPLVDAESIEQLIAVATPPSSAAICPSRDRNGTNALLIRPPGAMSPSFGPGSFQRHIALARELGLDVSVVHSDALGLDIDEPQDLDLFLSVNALTHAGAVLRERVSG